MKTYVKPVAEVREFEVSNNIASLSSWLDTNADALNATGENIAAITSYYMTSEATFNA